jgi:hypothetical protein
MAAASTPTDGPEDEGRATGRQPPTLGDRIIRWGLIAGGIAAIIGLAVLVWDLVNPDPPAKLDARFEQVDIEHGVTFGDFEGQLEFAARGPSLVLAQATVTPTSTTTPTPTTTDTPTATPTDTPTATVTPAGTADPVAGVVETKRSDDPGELVLAPKGKPAEEATVALPEACRFDEGDIECAEPTSLTWAAREATDSTDPVVVSARRFLQVLRNTRRRTIVRNGKRFTEPLGVTVSMEAFAEGYGGKQVEVRWSLHRASGRRSHRAWLVNRRVFRRRLKVDAERISADFWVPMPRERARSFIRVSLYDEHRQRLTYKDTERFR